MKSPKRAQRSTMQDRAKRDRQLYFRGVAQARYVLRKVFRLVEAEAKLAGVDPLAHQGLIQIYGSAHSTMRIKEIADRLDISPAFASSLVKVLIAKGLVARRPDATDRRVVRIAITTTGRDLLHHIDEQVQAHVDYFTSQLSAGEREAAAAILMFYIGLTPTLSAKSTASSGAPISLRSRGRR